MGTIWSAISGMAISFIKTYSDVLGQSHRSAQIISLLKTKKKVDNIENKCQ